MGIRRRVWERGEATDGYALVAADNPLGLTAMRSRGVKYWWAGLCLLVLVGMYAGPVAAVFKQPVVASPVVPLPNIAYPSVGIPLLRVPKLKALAPLPPLSHAHTPATTAGTHPVAGTRAVPKTVRRRVPVVADSHTQTAPPAKQSVADPTDPFANAPVVSDSVGTPIALPAVPATTVAPAPTPAPPTTPDAPAVTDPSAPVVAPGDSEGAPMPVRAPTYS